MTSAFLNNEKGVIASVELHPEKCDYPSGSAKGDRTKYP
jgi:hypothetical protein